MAPYIAGNQISVAEVLGAIDTSSLPLAYEALLELGRSSGATGLTEQVQELMGIEMQQREEQARETVDEVMPVLEVSGNITVQL